MICQKRDELVNIAQVRFHCIGRQPAFPGEVLLPAGNCIQQVGRPAYKRRVTSDSRHGEKGAPLRLMFR